MVDKLYSRQTLPSKRYRELIGTALCAFNSNTSLIIENILSTAYKGPGWHNLLNAAGEKVLSPARNIITSFKGGDEICELYEEIVHRRSRIISSYQITNDNERMLCLLDKKAGERFVVTEEYLLEFVRLNEELCGKLHVLEDLMVG